MSIQKKLTAVQHDLKAPKGQYNNFGKYNYRSCEDIVEGVKPLLAQAECYITLTDDVIAVGDRIYIKATATFSDGENSIQTTAFAREPAEKKGMDASQISGTASSYARKYALNGLLMIDDTKDADTDAYQHQQQNSKPEPANTTTTKSVNAMRKAIAETDPSSCLEAWAELTQQEQGAVWKQFNKTEQATIKDLLKVARGE